MKPEESYQWNHLKKQDPPVHDGDIRIVTLPVQCLFEWSDKIVIDYDEETGHTEYRSGFVMKVLPNQSFVYKEEGEDSVFVSQTMRESG